MDKWNNGLNFLFEQSEKYCYLQIKGKLSPERVYEVYYFLNISLSPHCQHVIIDLKNAHQYCNAGIALFLTAIQELKSRISSVEVLGILSTYEINFKNLKKLGVRYKTQQIIPKESSTIHVTEINEHIRIDLAGDLNKDNIVPVKKEIIEKIHSQTRSVEFHFEKVHKMDAPAMAMMVITIKSLLSKEIISRVRGLTQKNIELATLLGLPFIADVDQVSETRKKNNMRKSTHKEGKYHEECFSYDNGRWYWREALSVN
ncbi:MAG: hypothetical protein SVW57_13665 [Thermodesulfobacteriota bacterium]|nr:hypothetical protein [Thermodesulfobacteriota bacterium]